MTCGCSPTMSRDEQRADEGDELNHVVCCRSDDVLLCGLDGSAMPWGPRPGEQACVVCDDLDASSALTGICPVTGRSCP